MEQVRLDRFIERLRGLSVVSRWNFQHKLTTENVAEHSFWVAAYAALMCMLDQVSETTLAWSVLHGMCHDFEESVTGDLPMLVKRHTQGQWDRIEGDGMAQLLKFLPESLNAAFAMLRYPPVAVATIADMAYVRRVVKAADILDCVIYTRTERRMGNTYFRDIELECVTSLRRMKMASVDLILDSFGYNKQGHLAVDLPKDMTHL